MGKKVSVASRCCAARGRADSRTRALAHSQGLRGRPFAPARVRAERAGQEVSARPAGRSSARRGRLLACSPASQMDYPSVCPIKHTRRERKCGVAAACCSADGPARKSATEGRCKTIKLPVCPAGRASARVRLCASCVHVNYGPRAASAQSHSIISAPLGCARRLFSRAPHCVCAATATVRPARPS